LTLVVFAKIGALKILKEITANSLIRRAVTDLGGLRTMVKILRDDNAELRCLSAETIANIARLRRARRAIRQHGGVKNLVRVRLYFSQAICSIRRHAVADSKGSGTAAPLMASDFF